jgi:glycosyltransferase involved in cell wall biosynthesis
MTTTIKNNQRIRSPSLAKYIKNVQQANERTAEQEHYLLYKNLLEREYGDGSAIVWDNTNQGYAYLSAKKYPKMKILHTRHGMVNFSDFQYILDVKCPRLIGVSQIHAKYLADTLNRKVKCVHNGIRLPPWNKDNVNNIDHNEKRENNNEKRFRKNNNNNDKIEEGYLLSLNRISREKGIHQVIDVAIETRNSIKIVGDDKHVSDLSYVEEIKRRCKESRGCAQYYVLLTT